MDLQEQRSAFVQVTHLERTALWGGCGDCDVGGISGRRRRRGRRGTLEGGVHRLGGKRECDGRRKGEGASARNTRPRKGGCAPRVIRVLRARVSG